MSHSRPNNAGRTVTPERNHNDVVVVVLPPGEHITGEIALATAEVVHRAAGEALVPVLLNLSGVLSVSREARTVFSQSRSSSAIAVLGTSPVDRVIGNFLLGGEPPSCRTRFFFSRTEALDWLAAEPSTSEPADTP